MKLNSWLIQCWNKKLKKNRLKKEQENDSSVNLSNLWPELWDRTSWKVDQNKLWSLFSNQPNVEGWNWEREKENLEKEKKNLSQLS
jgi:hypothetical protein